MSKKKTGIYKMGPQGPDSSGHMMPKPDFGIEFLLHLFETGVMMGDSEVKKSKKRKK